MRRFLVSNRPRRTTLSACLLAACLATGSGIVLAAPISGAIFTSDTAGNVNVNQYESKADVYLNGGPRNSNCAAAGVDDGTYVYQITNPSGTVLLSSDDISHREFTVVGGVITSATDHSTVAGDCGGVRVQMAPFDDTPNNGGVYKAWITRKSDYIANGNTFRPSDTKTDNFMVKQPAVEPDLADLTVYKFYDFNGNGVWDSDENPLFGWSMRAQNGAGFDETHLTESPDGLTNFLGLSVADNPYSVTEGTAGGTWVQSVSLVNGVDTPASPENPVSALNLVAGETTTVIFGNYCTCKSGGKAKSWWVTASGQTKVNDGASMNPEFNVLNALNLKTAGGLDFTLNTALAQATNWTNLTTWLNSTSTTNMAYSLSRNLAILRLNIEAGYMVNTNFYAPAGATIAQLQIDANTALGIDGNTPVGDPNRAVQSQLNTWLVALNNAATVIRSKPCPYSFTVAPTVQ